ncbi:hypothetical protein [Streptomyces sp. NPDC047974]|uniref:hypothetical protein n=1 Tax=Streptomyces sp. NPDC047974 TaxID=3154343 RepID=UPI0033D830AA
MTPDDPAPETGSGSGEELRRHVEELTAGDRRRDRRLFWLELLVVLVVAAALTARELWLT